MKQFYKPRTGPVLVDGENKCFTSVHQTICFCREIAIIANVIRYNVSEVK